MPIAPSRSLRVRITVLRVQIDESHGTHWKLQPPVVRPVQLEVQGVVSPARSYGGRRFRVDIIKALEPFPYPQPGREANEFIRSVKEALEERLNLHVISFDISYLLEAPPD